MEKMSDQSLVPTYNLKAVLKETGLKADTLRAWERRYGLPDPVRSSGGHRLFSQKDIDTLKWLIARQEEGLSISRAVELWRGMEEQEQDPLQTMPLAPTPDKLHLKPGVAVDELRHAWILACKAFNENRAEQLLTQAFAQFPPETVCLDVLVKGLSEIGDGWYQGEISVQQEHLASSLATRRIEALLTAAPPPSYPGTILILCPPNDEHTFSPLVLTYLLRRRGRMAIFLGANVPIQRFEEAVQSLKPLLVVITAQDLRTAASILSFHPILEQADIPFAYGGLVFNLIPDLRDRIPGHFLGETLVEAPDAVEDLISQRPKHIAGSPVKQDYQQAYEKFTQKQAALRARVEADLSLEGIEPQYLTDANIHLTSDVIAALRLGNLDFLTQNMGWVKGLIQNYGIPAEVLDRYVDTYQAAVKKVIGDDGKVVSDYLEHLDSVRL
jgi:DNA-binding transcriptional MerR regulator